MTEDKKRILLVDDEPQLLAGLQVHLRRHYEVFVAESGMEGLEQIREHGPFAVIVSDMRMPGMNGVDFLRAACQSAPDSVRILLTGYADVESAIGAVNEGRVFRFLTKPCPPPELLGAVGEAADRYEEKLEEKAYLRGEKHRVSNKIVEAERMAVLGTIASGAGRKLSNLAQTHNQLLEGVIANAETGGFVSVDELEQLRDVEHYLMRTARSMREFADADQEAGRVDLREVARRAVDLAGVIEHGEPIRIRTEFQAGVPAVVAVGSQLEQVVVSLLCNAIDATEKTDRSAEITVRVGYDRETDETVLEVDDNGSGIHAEARPFILRPYFSTKGGNRSGLGLAVAKSIVKSWHGRLEFDSVFGSGSTFRVVLPAAVQYEATTTRNRDELSEARG